MSDVVVLGSLNMDLVVRTPHIPRPGETISGEGFQTIPGGKGANQAAAAARLGAKVDMVGRVGDDSFGPVLLDNMRQQGVGVSHVLLDDGAASGIAMIVIDAQGENSIVIAPGANGRVSEEDLLRAEPLLSEARYLILQFEIPLPVVSAAIDMSREMDLAVILNPAPAYPVDSSFLRGVYCLVANETETEGLTEQSVSSMADLERASADLLGFGISVAIITLGARGAYLATEDHQIHVPAREVDVVDTTAAGDAFVGGLAAGLLKGLDLTEAVRYATCAGTLATTKLGAQTSLPSAEAVDAFYQESLS